MDEAAIKLEMRLIAIERLLTDVYVQLLLLTGQPTEVLEKAMEKYAADPGNRSFRISIRRSLIWHLLNLKTRFGTC